MSIRFFGLTTCVACKKVKEYLDQSGVEYDCVFVDKLTGAEREEAVRELTAHNPRATFPTVVAKGVVVVGLDLEKLQKTMQVYTSAN